MMNRPASRRRATNPSPMVGALLDAILGRDQRSATVRLAILLVSVATYWLTLSFYADFPRVLPEAWLLQLVFPLNVLADLITSLFAPKVLLHLLPVAAAIWISFRLAAHYLADLFELESPAIASKYLMAAVFGIGYDTLHVAQSDRRLLNQSSPLLRIGGPGFLHVHLGFAVVMETAEGLPRIYGPGQRRFIEGFERLRDVIDLRDQLREIDHVRAVTADGIEVRARDVQMVFRVHGGDQPRSLEMPYPYTEAALRRLVYARPIGEAGLGPWPDELADLAASEIRSFVGGLTLETFLALQPETVGESGERASRDRGHFHIPRRKLTERFHTESAHQRLAAHGLELDWVGVGTWEVGAGEAEAPVSIGTTIVGAWRNVQRSRLLQSPSYLARQHARGFEAGVSRPLERWIAVWRSDEWSGRHRCWHLLRHIHTDLDKIRDISDMSELNLTSELDSVDAHLERLTRARRFGTQSS